MVSKFISPRERSADFDHASRGKDSLEIDGARRLAIYPSMCLSIYQRPRRQEYFRSKPWLPSSRRFGRIVRHLRGRLDIRVGRFDVSCFHIGRANRPPPAGLAVATGLSSTMAVHLNPRVLEFPLASVSPTPLYHLWSSPWGHALREARRVHRRIRRIRFPPPRWYMGYWEWDGTHHHLGVLPYDGCRSYHGGCLQTGDRDAGARMDWLDMDNVVDDFVGYVLDRWVGKTWGVRPGMFP